MEKQKGGAIINISSAWAVEPSAMFPVSGVFRAGLAAFTKLFADQYGASNVRMNNVLPGWIDSLPAKRGAPPERAAAALRHQRGNRGDHRLSCLGRWRPTSRVRTFGSMVA